MGISKESILLKSAHQIPTVTIFVDASYDNELKVGAWASRLYIGNKIIVASKIIATDVNNSTEAERVGVAAVLHIANKNVNISEYKLILYCDNNAATRPVTLANKTGKAKQAAKKQLEFYQKHIEPLLQKALIADIRYIKGHLARGKNFKLQKKHYIHDQVDEEAKKLLNEYRSKVQ
jgi:ribonuclease HI